MINNIMLSLQNFTHKAEELLSDELLRSQVICKAKEYVSDNHNLPQERHAYLKLGENLLIKEKT